MPKTENGHYFLDADPEYFRVILNFLRLGKVVLSDPKCMEGVLELADYLGLQDVILEDFERKNKSSVVVLDLNGEKEIKITRQQLTKMANSKMADFFSGHQNELSQWIVKENENRYFISRPRIISQCVFDFLKEFNTYKRISDKVTPGDLTNELRAYGIFKGTHFE